MINWCNMSFICLQSFPIMWPASSNDGIQTQGEPKLQAWQMDNKPTELPLPSRIWQTYNEYICGTWDMYTLSVFYTSIVCLLNVFFCVTKGNSHYQLSAENEARSNRWVSLIQSSECNSLWGTKSNTQSSHVVKELLWIHCTPLSTLIGITIYLTQC